MNWQHDTQTKQRRQPGNIKAELMNPNVLMLLSYFCRGSEYCLPPWRQFVVVVNIVYYMYMTSIPRLLHIQPLDIEMSLHQRCVIGVDAFVTAANVVL